jgi:hypothetical protein
MHIPLATFLTTRMQTLDEHLSNALALLKEYEIELLFEDDPLRKSRYVYRIAQIKESSRLYREEYDLLQRELNVLSLETAPPKSDTTTNLSQKMNTMGNMLLGEIDALRTDLLAQYAKHDMAVMERIVTHLNRAQIFLVNELIEAVQDNGIPHDEIKQLIQILSRLLDCLPQNTLPEQNTVKTLLSKPEGSISHKLKLSLPIIPAILSYEGEISMDQKAKLVEWVKRHLPTSRQKK